MFTIPLIVVTVIFVIICIVHWINQSKRKRDGEQNTVQTAGASQTVSAAAGGVHGMK